MKHVKTKTFLMTALLALLFAMPAHGVNYSPAFQRLTEFNRAKPLQNPHYEHLGDVLDRRVLDNKNKVVGEVRDILVTQNGSIDSIRVDFDRLRLGSPVFLNYNSMRIQPSADAYSVGFRDSEIAEIYPSLLADMATAAGSDEDVFDVRALKGAQVHDNTGRILGKVDEILFNEKGSRVEALYVSMSYGKLNGESLAIPFNMGRLENTVNGKRVVLDKEQADAMIDFASTR
jgi:sporulation protein YlmC with PRC-barrel domain